MKNPYCKGSKIDPARYRALVSLWHYGHTAVLTSKALPELGLTELPRETITIHFGYIGEWSYQNIGRPFLQHYHQRLQNSDPQFDKCSFAFFEEVWKKAAFNVASDRADIRAIYNGGRRPSTCSEMAIIEPLVDRFRRFNGFTEDAITRHLGWAFWRHFVNRRKFQPIDGYPEDTQALAFFLRHLAKKPIQIEDR